MNTVSNWQNNEVVDSQPRKGLFVGITLELEKDNQGVLSSSNPLVMISSENISQELQKYLRNTEARTGEKKIPTKTNILRKSQGASLW